MSLVSLKEYKGAVLLGAGCALWCILSVHSLLIFLLFLGGVPIFYSYLSYDQKDGLISAICAAFFIVPFMPFQTSADICLNIILPSSIIGHFSLKNIVQNRKKWWYPESFLLNNLVIIFSFVLVIVSLTFRTEESITKVYDEAMKLLFDKNADVYTQAAGQNLRSLLKYYGGIATLHNMLAVIVNLQIAQALGRRLKTNIRPFFDALNIKISNWLAVFPLVAFTLAKMFPAAAYIFYGLFVVGLFAPMVSGFSILGFVAKKRKMRRTMTIFMILLIIFPLPLLFLAVLLGIIDSFYPMRKEE